MPWMNAEADLIQTDVLAGEVGAALERWQGIWEDVESTSAWERWLLGGKLAALRAEIALETEDAESAASWAGRAIKMARGVHRTKYEAVAHTLLGKSLMAMRRVEDATREMRLAVEQTDKLGSPWGSWRARAELARLLEETGDENGAEVEFRAVAEIIRSVAAGLKNERGSRFLSAQPVADVLARGGSPS
jgi:hypothetical protein